MQPGTVNRSDFCCDLLVARLIERLCLPWKSVRLLHDHILRIPGRLSHLLMIEILEQPQFALLEPYLHRRHIGTVTFPKSEVVLFLTERLSWWWLTILQEHLAREAMEILAPLN